MTRRLAIALLVAGSGIAGLGMAGCAGRGPLVPDPSSTSGTGTLTDGGVEAGVRTDSSATGGDLPDVAAVPTVETAVFRDARALGADPSGRLYVVDAGGPHVVVFAPDGRAEAVVGGPGTDAESLLDPVDVDPTNGLAVYVADAGTQQVVRFTAERRAAEAIAVPEARAGREVAGSGRDRSERGRPSAVAAGPGGVLYIAEAERGVVLALDAARRAERVVGGPESGAAALRAPVALAVDARGRLYVAEATAVQTFDAFGAAGARLAAPDVGEVRGVAVSGRSVLLVGRLGVAVFRDGVLVSIVPSPSGRSGPVPLVDAAVAGGTLWGLARGRLVRLGPFVDVP